MNNDIYKNIYQRLKFQNLNIFAKDLRKPWGGFFLIDDLDFKDFANIYFDGLDTDKIVNSGKLSSKILIIEPNKRLSWQYHNRRSEIWKVVSGEIKVVTSHDDKEREKNLLKVGDKIKLYQGERHRIVGTNNYAVVAEIWVHTDNNHPSDENDIVRIQDDFGR